MKKFTFPRCVVSVDWGSLPEGNSDYVATFMLQTRPLDPAKPYYCGAVSHPDGFRVADVLIQCGHEGFYTAEEYETLKKAASVELASSALIQDIECSYFSSFICNMSFTIVSESDLSAERAHSYVYGGDPMLRCYLEQFVIPAVRQTVGGVMFESEGVFRAAVHETIRQTNQTKGPRDERYLGALRTGVQRTQKQMKIVEDRIVQGFQRQLSTKHLENDPVGGDGSQKDTQHE